MARWRIKPHERCDATVFYAWGGFGRCARRGRIGGNGRQVCFRHRELIDPRIARVLDEITRLRIELIGLRRRARKRKAG